MNVNVEKYKSVLVGFDKKDHNQIASLLDIVINYIGYKFNDENINFKITAAYVIVMLFKEKNITKKDVYSMLQNYYDYYNIEFLNFMSENGKQINNDLNQKFCEKYIENYEREN